MENKENLEQVGEKSSYCDDKEDITCSSMLKKKTLVHIWRRLNKNYEETDYEEDDEDLAPAKQAW